ncbi:MAG: phosphonate ABC transporter ATP-binding protein [Beijerinckiaceae bacterium]
MDDSTIALQSALTLPDVAALRIRKLTKEFGSRRILDGVDLDIPANLAVSLIGANGSGKSTLLRCIVRLVEPTSGEVHLFGEDVRALGGRTLQRLRSQVGFVFQKHNLVPGLSALSNVLHGVQARSSGPRTWVQSVARADARDEALACLAAVGLESQALQRVDSLSGGQSQRVAIARMLMQRPQILLADEPDASLDPRTGREIMELLYQLTRSRGIPVVIASHGACPVLLGPDRWPCRRPDRARHASA